jgi:hypothetical protein
MTNAPAPLSIVIASLDPGPVIFDCLTALESGRGFRVEVIVADASADDTADRISARFPWVRVLEAPQARSLPRLRGLGMANATAPVLGILDAWCLPRAGWITDAIRVHRDRAELVIGGGVELEESERGSVAAWATYLFDYWEFVSPFATGVVGVLPGNNITYKRAALPDAETLRSSGFWKAFTNAKLREAGHSLWASPGLAVGIRRRVPLFRFFRSRYHHGRSYAAMRVRDSSRLTRWKWALATPALPILFMMRQMRGLAGKPTARGWFAACAPLLLAFHVSWAWGELCGYLAGAGVSDDAIQI